MAGFEVIVRPVVFPNIRPQVARVLPPEDDPTQGFCELAGGGGQLIDLPYSYSWSMSRSMQQVEAARQSDQVRVFQLQDALIAGKNVGKINRDNYVDIKVMKAALIIDNKGQPQELQFRPVDDPDLPDNVEIIKRDIIEWWE